MSILEQALAELASTIESYDPRGKKTAVYIQTLTLLSVFLFIIH